MKFTESDIRPNNLMAQVQEYNREDCQWLKNHKEDFVTVDCPACESENNSCVYEKCGMQYSSCDHCMTMFINPRPTAELLGAFYAQSKSYKFQNETIFPASESVRNEHIVMPRIKRIVEICQEYGLRDVNAVEVGAGYGTFCSALQEHELFKSVIAVEPGKYSADNCRKRGVSVIECAIESVQDELRDVDLFCSFEVLEHLFEPKKFIEACHKKLHENGLLVLSCPNGLGFDIVELGSASASVNHQHINYFNPKSISILLAKCGFKVLEVSTPGQLDADIVRSHWLKQPEAVTSQFLRMILVDGWKQYGDAFQGFLAKTMLSSHMWIVAQKS